MKTLNSAIATRIVAVPRIVDHEARRREITAAMWRLYVDGGRPAVTIRALARETGWSVGTIQHYFKSQDDLLLFATREMLIKVAARLAVLDFSNPTRDTITSAVAELIPLDAQRRAEARIWFDLLSRRATNADLNRQSAEVDTVVRHAITEFFEQMRDLGMVHSSRDTGIEVARLHALIDGVALHGVSDPPSDTPETMKRVIEIHLADLATRPSGR